MTLILLRSARSWLGVACALTAAFLFAPTSVHAGCGDYVILGGKAQHVAHPMPPSSDRPLSAPTTPLRQTPCTGPHCSPAAPPSTPITAPPPAPVTGEHWGCVVASLNEPDPLVRDALAHGPCLHPIHLGSSIFHPPR